MNRNVRYEGHYHVVNTETHKSIESHKTLELAERACTICNDHEVANNRPEIYKVEIRKS